MMWKISNIMHALLALLCLLVTTEAGRPLKILGIFPHPGHSHFMFFHPIMRGLAEVGHEVTVISHFPDKSPPVRYRDIPILGAEPLVNVIGFDMFSNRHFYTHILEFLMLHEYGRMACNMTLRSDALQQVLHERKQYDVIITEQFNTDCALGITHALKAPVVGLSSSAIMPWYFERFGIPIIPSYTPSLFLGVSEEMSFFQRVHNWFNFHLLNILYHHLNVPAADAMIRHKFGHDVPSVADIGKNISLLLVNTHFSLMGVKPLPPSVIEVGGVHIQKAKPLPVELQRWLDNAEHGVVLISWGSMLRSNSLPVEKRDSLLRALKRLKQRVIWKWENDTLPNKPDNLLITKWLPQRDILCHPNVKVFMGHGGLMGASEAVHCGVPMVVTPMYGDQFLNAAALQRRGVGVILNYEDMTENSIIKAIKKALDKSYQDNAKSVGHSYNHRPMTALQTAIWWIEYVARTEGAPLTRSPSVHMSRFVYYSLDVYLVFGVLIGLLIYFWISIFRLLCTKKQKYQKIKSN